MRILGRAIDPSKISKEIKDWGAKLKILNENIEKNERNDKKVKDDIAKLRSEENNLKKKILELKAGIEKIEDFEAKMKNIQDEIKRAEVAYNSEKDDLIKNFQEVKEQLKNKLSDFSKKEDENQKEFLHELNLIIEDMEAFKKEITIKKLVQVKEKLNELIITKISEISTTLNHLNSQKKQILGDIEESKNYIKRLDKQIASNEKNIQILQKKEILAKKYRDFKDIFKKAQVIIRENASVLLEEEILKLHRFLSSDNEFEKVHIDSKDYSLSVSPLGMNQDEFFPAWVYEGGGHKLILGLSYKFSLGKIIGDAPFLLIDEPTEFMDDNNRVNLLSNLSSTAKDTQVVLITHHNVDKIQCDKKIEIKK